MPALRAIGLAVVFGALWCTAAASAASPRLSCASGRTEESTPYARIFVAGGRQYLCVRRTGRVRPTAPRCKDIGDFGMSCALVMSHATIAGRYLAYAYSYFGGALRCAGAIGLSVDNLDTRQGASFTPGLEPPHSWQKATTKHLVGSSRSTAAKPTASTAAATSTRIRSSGWRAASSGEAGARAASHRCPEQA